MRQAEDVTFGASSLDRAAHLRGDLAPLRARADATTILVWRGKPLVAEEAGTLVRLPLDAKVLSEPGQGQVFLGLDNGAPLFATDISGWKPSDIDEDAMKEFFDASENHHPGLPSEQSFVELRGAMAWLSPEDANIAATARGLYAWHQTHPFCARCGDRSDMKEGGWQRTCPACGGHHFPRTDPVVIVLALHGNSVLLGRSPHWPEGMYSLLAGFVEPGEGIEAASRREVFEESGVRLGEVTYLASQPWPFPSSLMFGTLAIAETTEISLDPNELEDACWVTREEIMEAVAGNRPDLRPARKGSIARFLIDRWLADDLN